MENVKDDLDKFIALQKQRLNQEKKELRNSQNSPRRDPQENSQGKRQMNYQSRNNDVEGLAIGDYEKKQRKLKEERVQDYKRYAAEQEFRRTGRHLPVDGDDYDDAKRRISPRRDAHKEAFAERREVTTPDIVDAYAELLRKKRAEERSYREHFDDQPVTSNRKVQFNENQNAGPSRQTFDDEDALFDWAREKAKLTNRQQSAGTTRVEKEDFVKESESKRAKSVPPNVAAGIFGGGESTTSALQRKKDLYKQELELQIKEKEEQKHRDKLRRMGRLSSQDDLRATNETISKDNTKTERKSKQKTDDSSPRSRRQRTPDRSSRQRQRRSKYDDRGYDDDDEEDMRRHYDERKQYRGQQQYGDMQGYDPRMQMMPSRYDMVDPYSMQRGFYGGGFPGPRGMMFGGNPALMNQMQAYNQFDFKDDRFHDEDRKRTPRSRSKQEGERERVSETNKNVKENVSPRDAMKAGVFGESEETDKDHKRAAKVAYQQELQKQMQEKQEAKQKEKRERERYDAKIEAEIAIYDPWGKSGAGAPVKDQRGKVVADLRTMHKMKEDGQLITSPRDEVLMNDDLLNADMPSLPKESPMLAALENLSTQRASQENQNDFVNISPRAQRGAALREIQGDSQTTKQKAEQLEYQDQLKHQIEEKKRIKLEQERKEKEAEEKENRRLEEQRLKLERDFLAEQERERKKEEETRQQNDEMRKAAEQKRHEAQKIHKEIKEESMNILPPKTSSELQTHSTMIGNRSSSPPLPAIAKQQRQQQKYTSMATHQSATENASTDRYHASQKEQYNVSIQQSTAQQSTAQQSTRQQSTRQQSVKTTAEETTDSDMYYLNSIREELFQRQKGDHSINQQNSNQGTKNASETHIIKQLAALRRQLSVEETKVQNELQMNMGKYEESKSKPASKKIKPRNMEIFERARIRKGSFSKKPPVKVDEFNNLTDASSVLEFKAKFPSKPVTSSDLDLQQREFIRLQEQKLQALRQAIRETSDNLMLDIETDKSSTEKQRRPSKQSLLESDSKFINLQDQINDENDETKSRQSSARSRRRAQKEEDNYLKKPKSPGGYSVGSMTSQAIEDLAAKNEARLRRLRGNDSGNEHEDPEDVIEQYMKDSLSKSLNRRDSDKSLPSSTSLQR